MIAHLWKIKTGWLVEIAKGAPGDGFAVLAKKTFARKSDAKKWAKEIGATPWNY